jgi:Flp pilus assembly protein TadG
MKATHHTSQSGSAFVEAAVVTPMLLMLIVSMMQFGYIYGVLTNLRGASAVAARMAVLGTASSQLDVCQAARNAVTSMVDSSQLDCQTSPSILPAPMNSPVTITLSYPVPLLASNSGVFKGPTFTVSARTTMQ